MAATDHERRFLVVALVLSLVAVAVLVGDKITNPDIAHRQTFDLLQLIFAAIALGCGVVVMVRLRRRPQADEQVVDLRERLGDLVDLDDVHIDKAMPRRRVASEPDLAATHDERGGCSGHRLDPERATRRGGRLWLEQQRRRGSSRASSRRRSR